MTKDRTPTIQAKFNDPSGVDLTSITCTLDSIDVTDQATVTTSALTYTPTLQLSYADHTVAVTVADTLGNIATKEWTFTVREIVTKVNETIENLSSGETETIELQETETGLDTIQITASNDIENIEIIVEKLDDIPEDVQTKPTKTVYAYLNIETNVDEKDLESFKITFKVTYEWLEENNVDKESVILMRYHNGNWHELKTTILNEDAVYVYYEAETPGTSTFAIAGEQMIVETQTEISFMNYIVIAAAVAAIVVIGVSVVYFRRRQ